MKKMTHRNRIRVAIWTLLLALMIAVPGHAAHRNPPAAECPQPRFTGTAPEAIYSLTNPLKSSRSNRRAGRALYEEALQPACADCHGKKGEGNGQLAGQFDPRPRNFACRETINGISDGQLYWIVKNGSPGTAMPPFDFLEEEEIWQLVLYLRALANHD